MPWLTRMALPVVYLLAVQVLASAYLTAAQLPAPTLLTSSFWFARKIDWRILPDLLILYVLFDKVRYMKHIIQFHIYKGERQYVAEGIDLPVVTQGKTLDELAKNLQEAVELQLEGENLADFGIAPQPSILANLELTLAHA